MKVKGDIAGIIAGSFMIASSLGVGKIYSSMTESDQNYRIEKEMLEQLHENYACREYFFNMPYYHNAEGQLMRVEKTRQYVECKQRGYSI